MNRQTRAILAMVAWWLCLCLLSGCGTGQPVDPDAESSEVSSFEENSVSDTEAPGEDTLYGDTDGDVEIHETTTEDGVEIPPVTEPASTEPTGDVSETDTDTDTDTQTEYKPVYTTTATWWETDDQTREAEITTTEDTQVPEESGMLRLPPSPTISKSGRRRSNS